MIYIAAFFDFDESLRTAPFIKDQSSSDVNQPFHWLGVVSVTVPIKLGFMVSASPGFMSSVNVGYLGHFLDPNDKQ